MHTYRHAHTYRPCFIRSEATNSRSINKRTCSHTIMCPNHTIATHVPSCIHIQRTIFFIQPCFFIFFTFFLFFINFLCGALQCKETNVSKSSPRLCSIHTLSIRKRRFFFCFPNRVPSASLICIGALNRQS